MKYLIIKTERSREEHLISVMNSFAVKAARVHSERESHESGHFVIFANQEGCVD